MLLEEKISDELAKKIIACQIYYLELLKKHGALEVALRGILPDKVHKAAMYLALTKFPGVPYDKENMNIPVPPDLQHRIDEEIEEFLIHYEVAKRSLLPPTMAPIPREFVRKKRYQVKSGSHAGKVFYNRGEDESVYGIPWIENANNPECNHYVFRIQKDKLPLTGKVLVGQIGNEDVLIHESEVGEMQS